jgi:kinase suppressor of Ras 2
LLCGEWPFNEQPPEAIIWQVGKGIKQSLANLQASRDVKVNFFDHFVWRTVFWKVCCPLQEILMLCWAFKSLDRPDFSQLLNTLNKLPKKRLARSPSHPVHLSRSAESVF